MHILIHMIDIRESLDDTKDVCDSFAKSFLELRAFTIFSDILINFVARPWIS